MHRIWIVLAALSLSLLVGCAQKDSSEAAPDANAQHATVLMRDGSAVTGTVTASTPSQITLNTDSGGTRTVLMKDVRSVQYGDATNDAGSATNAAAPVPTSRPDTTAIKTTTFQIPAGTEVAVRNDEMIDSSKTAEGQTYAAEVTADVRDAKGDVVIPRGA